MGKKSSDKPFENLSCSEDILSLITIFSNKIGTLFFFAQTIPMVQPESGYGFDEKQSSQFRLFHSWTWQCIFLPVTGTGIYGCESPDKKK